MSAGDHLKQFRASRRLKQEYVAMVAGISVKTLSDYENNIISPRFDTLKKIADHADILVCELIGEGRPFFDWTPKERAVAIAAVNAMRNYKGK